MGIQVPLLVIDRRGVSVMSLIYCMTCVSIIKRHVIALPYRYELAIVVEAIVGGDNHVTTQ